MPVDVPASKSDEFNRGYESGYRDAQTASRATVARLRTAADDLCELEFNEGHLDAEDALRSVADWLETPRFSDMSDGEVEHDLRLIADRLVALRAALDATTAEAANGRSVAAAEMHRRVTEHPIAYTTSTTAACAECDWTWPADATTGPAPEPTRQRVNVAALIESLAEGLAAYEGADEGELHQSMARHLVGWFIAEGWRVWRLSPEDRPPEVFATGPAPHDKDDHG